MKERQKTVNRPQGQGGKMKKMCEMKDRRKCNQIATHEFDFGDRKSYYCDFHASTVANFLRYKEGSTKLKVRELK
jgi:hypothetical protein